MQTMLTSKETLNLINKIGYKNDFFIDNKGPWKITNIDSIAENCRITLYKDSEYADAYKKIYEAGIKFNIRTVVVNEVGKSLDDSNPDWLYDEVISLFVPFDFFRVNTIELSFPTTKPNSVTIETKEQ